MKHESPFRCSLVRGFASDRAHKERARTLRMDLEERLISPPNHPIRRPAKGWFFHETFIGTRYANGHPAGAPFEHYGPIQSQEAIRYAGEIIEFVRVQMA